jgi:hypothetical protein
LSCRYDEFGRRKRSKQADEDKRAREAAALQRLYGGTNMAPSEQVSSVALTHLGSDVAGQVQLLLCFDVLCVLMSLSLMSHVTGE